MIFIASTEPDSIKYGLDWQDKTAIIPLETGDIMLVGQGKQMLIERKAAGDLVNSISDGRLVEQCSRLVSQADYPILLTHGSLLANKEGKVVADGQQTYQNWWGLQMMLVSVQAGGVMLLHLSRVQDIPMLVKYLQNWLNKESHLHVSKREKMPFVLPKPGMEILSALPGIGLSKANDCLDYFGSAGMALAELTCPDGEECFLPRGVARGTVNKVRDELGLQDNERLVIETAGGK